MVICFLLDGSDVVDLRARVPGSKGVDNFKELAKGLVGYWYQSKTKRMMQIIRNEKGKYHIKPLSSHELENEMSIAKPKGQVKLTDRMVAYFLAAAGGTWTRSDLGVGNRKTEQASSVKGLFFDFTLESSPKSYLDVLWVQQRYADGKLEEPIDVERLSLDATGHGPHLTGVWRLEPTVPSVRPETIKIEYTSGAFHMEVLPQIAQKA
ncbi:hypothetical protein AX14_007152 [Amanita brunnescens Koide BX004]|nr:hypothetical protein AX14_007152 [Amanita brunnescens Koide BX004]